MVELRVDLVREELDLRPNERLDEEDVLFELLELFGQANMLKWHLKQVPINSHPQSLHLERESYVFDEILESLNSIVANREPHLEGFELAAQRDAPVLDKNTSSLALRI